MVPFMSVVEQPASPADDGPSSRAIQVAERKQEIRRRLERLIGIAATEGNELRVLRNGDEIFPAMLGGDPGGRAHDRHDDVRLLAR